MRKLSALLVLFFVFLSAQAQILNPVSWKTSVEKKSDTEVVLIFDAVIEHEWHMFSQFTPEGGSSPSVFNFKNAKGNYELVGKTKESPYKKVYSDIFEVDEYMFENKAQFRQTIKVTNPNLKSVSVTVEYQVCKEACIQQDKTFDIKLPALSVKPSEVVAATAVVDTALAVTEVKTDSVPTSESKETAITTPVAENEHPAKKKAEEKGVFMIFILAFFSGFAALLTPCVFPMIPMTVSFFTKQSKTKAQGVKNAIIYGISIIFIYVLLGSLVTAIFGADALNALSTNVWFNLIFFVLLVIFAASFLGAFEIMLPNSWANKVDRQADRGGIIGILFMALALAIVSFSCTGPIVGTLLVEAASKGGFAPIIGMLGFSMALALPFMLFAMFPGWLNSLPKSGGWLNTVKVFLGFLELALAFKFLSNADLVLQMHLLEREIFLAIWIVIFGTLAFYLFGKITLPHDSPLSHISVGRLLLGLLVLSFTIYLIPGLWGAPLKLISGFPPPMTYSESPYGLSGSKGNGNATAQILPNGAHLGAHDIVAFEDYEKGMAYAKSVNKPVLLDFTGFACVNCRKMEDFVWSKPEVLSILKEKVVLISLYVDDKRELPKNEQYTSKETGKEIITVGNKWSDFQITKYKANAQPYYIVLDTEANSLSEPVGYTPDVTEYKKWLEDGIAKFKK
ncbi:protein-disulfide reductase DsbD family protein [Flavobacterium enshiense]|uniref:Thiol:disulfide interchange protein DsbD n=1 Tax=Flavobacterium enshiense DK69 TaxID=1107311 RepID=A0A0A2MYX8_9FLAO|nr:thioredoxin family protein [Flavobacterium enshiense]KGO96811.1 thiol:disulfide interchange protein DsbD [Flavobacterium enshiense DK69]